jgi:hypothetical protein
MTKRRNARPVDSREEIAKDILRRLLSEQPPPRSDCAEQELEGGERIIAHKESACKQERTKKNPRPCPIHSRTNHSMRSFPQHWRNDRGIMERICSHGIGHPDPDDPGLERDGGVHGCDGCCRPKQPD